MKPTIRLSIATPCTESWDQMTPQTEGRFCGTCQKTVVDFTAMDDQELLQWFATRQGPVCGRLRQDQLDHNIAAPPEHAINRWRYWNYLIAGLLFSSEAAAQTRPANPPTSQSIPIRPETRQLVGDTILATEKPFPADSVKGRVTDSGGRPISYVTILYGPRTGVLADEQGHFSIPVQKVSRSQQLTITAVGYEPLKITVDKLLTDYQVNLAETLTMRDVVLGGAVVVVKKHRRRVAADTVSLFKDTLALVGLAKPALTVYPNPVSRGASVTISARLDQKGKYNLQLYSSTGALVASREVERADNSARAELPIPEGLTPGIYFLKLSHPAMTKCYSQQIVVY